MRMTNLIDAKGGGNDGILETRREEFDGTLPRGLSWSNAIA